MHLSLLPACLLLILVNAQGFIYPPPLEGSLTDYTSGTLQSPLNFSAGDNLLGSWKTPQGLISYFLLRCTHTPSSTPIYPSNSTFNTSIGSVAPDGTWEQMPYYLGTGQFEEGVTRSSSIFFADDFFQGNDTTGSMCWYELYPGHESSNVLENGNFGNRRVVTVNSAGSWYFASVPFVVKPRRPTGQVVTWKGDGTKRGKPTSRIPGNATNDGGSSETLSIEFSSETTKASGATLSRVETGRFGIVLGLLFLILLEVIS